MPKLIAKPLTPTTYNSATEVLAAYARGKRDFKEARLDGANLSGHNLTGSSFCGSSLRMADFSGADLTYVQLKAADLTDANLIEARLNATDLIGANFTRASFKGADLTGAALCRANCDGADFSQAWLNNANVSQASFTSSKLSRLHVSSVNFTDLDLSAFCQARTLRHTSPSSIGARAVMKSQHCWCLKQFMLDCGVPEIFATYMIDCARALEEPMLKMLMQSTFLSYGGPDEVFARKIYTALRKHQVITFFFPETATIGERIESEIFSKIKEHDRILLVCSRNSLDRPGVIHEIRETLDREARDGGATYLLPITIDDYVYSDWKESEPLLAQQLGRRIIGDFRKAKNNQAAFDYAFERLLSSLKKK